MMDNKSSGKGVALLAKLGRRKPEESSAESDMPMGGDEPAPMDDKFDMACSDLADSIGLPEEKRDSFASAFKMAVKAATDEGDSDGGEAPPDMGGAGLSSVGM